MHTLSKSWGGEWVIRPLVEVVGRGVCRGQAPTEGIFLQKFFRSAGAKGAHKKTKARRKKLGRASPKSLLYFLPCFAAAKCLDQLPGHGCYCGSVLCKINKLRLLEQNTPVRIKGAPDLGGTSQPHHQSGHNWSSLQPPSTAQGWNEHCRSTVVL